MRFIVFCKIDISEEFFGNSNVVSDCYTNGEAYCNTNGRSTASIRLSSGFGDTESTAIQIGGVPLATGLFPNRFKGAKFYRPPPPNPQITLLGVGGV